MDGDYICPDREHGRARKKGEYYGLGFGYAEFELSDENLAGSKGWLLEAHVLERE